MRIAFYLPGGKLPDPLHGGAGAAGLLGTALGLVGHDVRPACRFCALSDGRTRRRDERIRELGLRLADRLVARYHRRPPEERPQAWFTCAVSDRAPDWLGPTVSRSLGIPYVVVQPEAGPSESGAGAAETPLRSVLAAADAILTIGRVEIADAHPPINRSDRLVELPLFLDLAPINAAHRDRARYRAALASRLLLAADAPWLITMVGADSVADQESIRHLARILSRMSSLDWNLIVAGDGPVCEAANAALRALPQTRVKLYPSLAGEDLIPLYVAGDLFLGPLIGDGSRAAMLLGMACGLPMVARQDDGAAAEIVRDGLTGRLTLPGNIESFGNAIAFLLRQPSFRASFAENARTTATTEHDIATAAQRLDALLRGDLTKGG
jgi:hypothetical protein